MPRRNGEKMSGSFIHGILADLLNSTILSLIYMELKEQRGALFLTTYLNDTIS
jgi:hypothetical protein